MDKTADEELLALNTLLATPTKERGLHDHSVDHMARLDTEAQSPVHHPITTSLRSPKAKHPQHGTNTAKKRTHRKRADDEPVMTEQFLQDSTSTSGKIGQDDLLKQQVTHLNRGVDACTISLKKELLSAFTDTQSLLSDHYGDVVTRLHQQHEKQNRGYEREIDELKELVETYMNSANTKDQVIANLKNTIDTERAAALQRERELELLELELEQQREHANTMFAQRHHETTLKRKCFRGLNESVQRNWKSRMEKACKLRAEEICASLSQEYETKIKLLTMELTEAHFEIEDFKQKSLGFQDGMKKAFMKGVSALNVQAMTMFNPGSSDGQLLFDDIHAQSSPNIADDDDDDNDNDNNSINNNVNINNNTIHGNNRSSSNNHPRHNPNHINHDVNNNNNNNNTTNGNSHMNHLRHPSKQNDNRRSNSTNNIHTNSTHTNTTHTSNTNVRAHTHSGKTRSINPPRQNNGTTTTTNTHTRGHGGTQTAHVAQVSSSYRRREGVHAAPQDKAPKTGKWQPNQPAVQVERHYPKSTRTVP